VAGLRLSAADYAQYHPFDASIMAMRIIMAIAKSVTLVVTHDSLTAENSATASAPSAEPGREAMNENATVRPQR
jgi:hypothetical protein